MKSLFRGSSFLESPPPCSSYLLGGAFFIASLPHRQRDCQASTEHFKKQVSKHLGNMGLCPIAPPKGFPVALWKPSGKKTWFLLKYRYCELLDSFFFSCCRTVYSSVRIAFALCLSASARRAISAACSVVMLSGLVLFTALRRAEISSLTFFLSS